MYQVGDIIDGEYKVLRVFTNGGMGVVYKVHHEEWNMDLAMKCPRQELFANEDSKKSFIKECRTWMDMGVHPNIVTCLYVKNMDSTPAIFIEYADGGSLADYIKSGQIYSNSPETALKSILDIAIQTARGLGFAHNKGYVHQDIKPANILMTRAGVAKVSDFGLSRASQSLSNYAPQHNQMRGTERSIVVSSGGCTPAYCSPEQILNRRITRRTDIWSWALMFLEMIHDGIFWRLGAEASRRLDKLWGWQVFSSKVKKCPEFLGLLKECVNENEENRPHDFTVVEQRLVAIYSSFFGGYPRRKPIGILLSAGALCNRIASYSAIEEYGEDIFHKILDARNDLRKNVRWAVWGEINYSVYCLKSGESITTIERLLENSLRRSTTKEDQSWIVNFLLSLGTTSPRLFYSLNSSLDDELKSRILLAHSSLRKSLQRFLSGERHCSTPFSYNSLPYYAKKDSDDALDETDEGYLVGRAISQKGECHVTVFFPKSMVKEKRDDDFNPITVKVVMNGKTFLCKDNIPKYSAIRFITVDDKSSMLSLWLSDNINGENIFYRKVSRIVNNELVPYRADYRKNEKWGRLAKVFQSGDARRLMTIDMDGECSIWVNDKSDSSDGINICKISLTEYGLIPQEIMLENLQLEKGFEYCVDSDLGYRILDYLAAQFHSIKRPCRIFTPSDYEEEEKKALKGAWLLEQSDKAGRNGLFINEANLLTEALFLGIVPPESKISQRHKIVMADGKSVIFSVWLICEKMEHWQEKVALLPADDSPAYEAIFLSVENAIEDKSQEPFKHFILLRPLDNGDVLACPLQDNYGWQVVGIGRYSTKLGRRYPYCNALARIWEYAFEQPESLSFLSNRGAGIKVNDKKVEVLLKGNTRKVVVDLDFGFVVEEILRCDKGTFTSVDRKVLYDTGNQSIVDVGWALILRGSSDKQDKIIVDYRLLPSSYCTWRWAALVRLSENGLAVAVVTIDKKLLVYCVNSGHIAFIWQLPEGKYQDMCFDKTGRWLSVLYDYHNVLTFQLLWNFPLDEGHLGKQESFIERIHI